MKKLFKVEAVKKGIVVSRAYQQASSKDGAIELAKMYAPAKGAKWSAEEAYED